MKEVIPLDKIDCGLEAYILSVKVSGELGVRLRDLGFVKGAKVEPLFSGSGIRAYAVCGTVIALRDDAASRVEVTYE